MSMSAALRTAQRSSLLQVVKSAVATVLAWFLAGWLIPAQPPVFAAIAALLVEPARRAVRALADDLAGTLDRLADALQHSQSRAQLDDLLARARAMRASRDAADAAIAAARDSLTLNPRAPRHRAELAALDTLVTTFTPIVTQAIGMTRAFHERYDDTLVGEPAIGAIAEQLRRAAHDVRFAPDRGAAPPTAGVIEPAALTRPLAVTAPSSDHWILVGSMMVDLLRIHHALVGIETE